MFIRKLCDPDFVDTIKQYDIILLSETWLSEYTHSNLDIDGFLSYHLFGNKSARVRRGRHSGVLSIYYKSALLNKITSVGHHMVTMLLITV